MRAGGKKNLKTESLGLSKRSVAKGLFVFRKSRIKFGDRNFIPPYPQNPADIWGGVGNGSRLVGWIVVLLSLLRRELGLHFSSAILAWSGAVSIFRLIPLRPNWAATGGDRSVTVGHQLLTNSSGLIVSNFLSMVVTL